MPIEGLDGLKNLQKNVQLVENYIQQLDGQEFTGEEHDIIFDGPILWDTDEQAKFELDNQKLIDRMRIIKQDINRLLKD